MAYPPYSSHDTQSHVSLVIRPSHTRGYRRYHECKVTPQRREYGAKWNMYQLAAFTACSHSTRDSSHPVASNKREKVDRAEPIIAE